MEQPLEWLLTVFEDDFETFPLFWLEAFTDVVVLHAVWLVVVVVQVEHQH